MYTGQGQLPWSPSTTLPLRPPRMLPPGACQAPSCRGDAGCSQQEVCCYNGSPTPAWKLCSPPPVLDWLVQPKPRRLGGSSWLLDGPEEVSQAESCSTTVDEEGEELLLCPSGFECLILVPEDKDKGIPNRGQCVREPQADGQFLRHEFPKEYPDGDTKNVAEHGKGRQGNFP
ncbi:WAP four-disulfide core domain protein 1 [Choloepus didactylus]|uniref:WAP four-disulfide core domain protein 1 n=1 Tax=Choloepus didactylus TaxID=27675 RepID=UPI0018A0EDFD|nr:WAP four-disulfide core domain protein 1 [Choloepus didactylus]